MEKPKCYIPTSLTGFHNRVKEPFVDIDTAVRSVLSVYLDYRCLPSEHNDREPDDPNGMGIFELICIKLIMCPEFSAHARKVYSVLDTIYERIVSKGESSISVMKETFTLDELKYYGF